MNVLIIEDEGLAAEKLVKELRGIESDINVLASIKSVEASLLWLKSNPSPDLIFSDIQLLDGLSFEIFSEHKAECPIIFTTAYDQYAIQAFEVNSIDYLLKPIKKEKLQTSLQKFHELEKGSSIAGSSLSTDDVNRIAQAINSKGSHKSRFLVKFGQRIRAISTNDIAYFYTEDKLTFVVTEDKQRFPMDNTLEELNNLLDPVNFFRINRKYIVKIDAVKEIHPYFKGRVKLELTPPIEDDIVVSSERTPAFKTWLGK